MAEPSPSLWEEIVSEIGDGDPYLEQAHGSLVGESDLDVAVSSDWARQVIERRYLESIRAAMQSRFPDATADVRIHVDSNLRTPPAVSAAPFEDLRDTEPEAPTEISPDSFRRERRTRILPAGENDRAGNINPRYTFDRFVVGSSNRLAHVAALSLAENPDGKTINPLFIYGGVGLGKTHLLHAIGNLVRQKHPHLKALYVSAETFTNDMVEAIRFSTANANRNKYRTIDVLLMDDIQFLQKKAQSQIEFYNTFNDLHNANKQIVLASDSYPKDIPELEERLRSRFMWGMITSIDTPEVETRIAILQRKAEDMGIDQVPTDVALYIAENVATNIRELEGALATVYRYAHLEALPVTVDLVRHVLRRQNDDGSSIARQPISTDLIQRVVADFYRMKPNELKAKKRTKRIATGRHVAMYLCRQLTDLSFVDIGQDFGGRDHSTVISACTKIEKEIERSSELARTIQEIIQRIQGNRR
ncbi:chromosomal replication initiator protein DnaA [Candidatus Poribacteria bacterium]|nr:chromosomal replication initiator protein DnaA [Candidatus Poribacteria bacterium]